MIKLSKLCSVAMVAVLGGCAYSDDAIFPSLFGSDVQENSVDERDAAAAGIVLGTTEFKPLNVSKVSDTGTFVGQKVMTFRGELNQLQNSIKNNNEQLQNIRRSVVSNALQYHKTVGMMEAKLQVGTTPGNPRMFDLLNSAQNNIQMMTTNLSALNQLAASVSADTANTDYLSEAISSAYSISGAVDEDHAHLRILENEANQTSVLMHSLLAEVNSDIERQQGYIDTANSKLSSLNEAIKIGSFGVNNAYMPTKASKSLVNSSNIVRSGASSTAVGSRPLFSANFANGGANYKESLKQAVGSAVAKKNDVIFDVVAVNPVKGSTAQPYASDVFQQIVAMGVSADRVNISSKTDASATDPMVMVFVK